MVYTRYIPPLGIYMVFTWYIPTIYLVGVPDHLDSCQTQLGAVISVYPDVTPDIGAHFLELWYWSCCDIGVFPISYTMISGTIISKYHWYRRYCDIGVSLISQYLWYRSSPAVISGYTDITAVSCDIGVIRISGFQILYPISQFQNSDIGTYTDVTAPDIGVFQISEFLISYLMFHYPCRSLAWLFSWSCLFNISRGSIMQRIKLYSIVSPCQCTGSPAMLYSTTMVQTYDCKQQATRRRP